MHYASKLVWFFGRQFAHKIHFVHKLHSIPSIFVLATKQTLLSIEDWLIMPCLDLFQIGSSLDLKTIHIQMNHKVWNPRCLEAT